MKKNKMFPVLSLMTAAGMALAGNLHAESSDAGFAKSLKNIQAEAQKEKELTPRERILSAQSAIRDSGGPYNMGFKITKFLEENSVSIGFNSQNEKTSYTRNCDPHGRGRKESCDPELTLDSRLDSHEPRYLTLLIAGEVSKQMDQHIPDSAEKEYMRLSRMSQILIETYGDPRALPILHGVKDEETASQLNVWFNTRYTETAPIIKAIQNTGIPMNIRMDPEFIEAVSGLTGKPTLNKLMKGNLEAQSELEQMIPKARHFGHTSQLESALGALKESEGSIRQAMSDFNSFMGQEDLWFMSQPLPPSAEGPMDHMEKFCAPQP